MEAPQYSSNEHEHVNKATIVPEAGEPLNLSFLDSCISKNPTYGPSTLLCNFKLFKFSRQLKIHTYMLKNIPQSLIIPPDEITRILPKSVISRCHRLVTALQEKKKGLAEKDIVLVIEYVGIMHTSTVAIMKRWHSAVGVISDVTETLEWISQINFSVQVSLDFRITRDSDFEARLSTRSLFSVQVRSLVVKFWCVAHLW